MSLFGCKDDSLLWFIILFILLFCTGKDNDCGCGRSGMISNGCGCNDDCC